MINELTDRYAVLGECVKDIESARDMLISAFRNGGKLLLCGNGGSAADCDHIVGELMKGFLKKRPLSEGLRKEMTANCPELDGKTLDGLQGALPAVSLPSFSALNSAFCNDAEPSLIYAQAVMGLGGKEDVLFCISTSGNSGNVVAAARTAKGLGIRVIALTGKGGGALAGIADVCIRVPESETYRVQELHLPVYHWLCAETEAEFFAE